MSQAVHEPGTWRPWAPWLALALWLASLVLAMQVIYSALQLYYLVFGVLGRLEWAVSFGAPFVCVVGLAMIIVVLGTAEYHRTRIDWPSSWRVFAWTLGGELAVLWLYSLFF